MTDEKGETGAIVPTNTTDNTTANTTDDSGGKTNAKINTMVELSEAIGISRPTLSRFFQDPKSVRPSTSQKIKERLKHVNYVYNFIATRQNRKNTGLIGVVIPHYNDLFFTSLLEAIDNSARAQGLTIIAQSSRGDEAAEVDAITKLRSMNVDGAIIAPLGTPSSNLAFEEAIDDFPLIFVDSRPSKPVKGADFVGTNNKQSIASMVKYLCRTGEKPVFLGMPKLNSNAVEREQSYSETMIALDNEPVFIGHDNAQDTWDFEAYGYNVMDDYFSRQKYTESTILCANDRIAIGVLRAANQHGLFDRDTKARSRFRVAGHDDHPLSEFMSPALTTIGQDTASIGAMAIKLLTDRAYGNKGIEPIEILNDAALRLRETT